MYSSKACCDVSSGATPNGDNLQLFHFAVPPDIDADPRDVESLRAFLRPKVLLAVTTNRLASVGKPLAKREDLLPRSPFMVSLRMADNSCRMGCLAGVENRN